MATFGIPLITTGNIADNAVTAAKMADDAIGSAEIAADSIVNSDINSAAAIAYSKLNLALGIVNADVNASAAIVDTKLAQIATAGKVSGAALTLLGSIPAGGGTIPSANLPSGLGLSLAGSNNTEGTTTSTTPVDILSVASLNIAATTPIMVVANIRRTGENANLSAVGMKLNATQVVSDANWPDGGAAVKSAILIAYFGARQTNYLRTGWFILVGNTSGTSGVISKSLDADVPTAAITDVVITGNAGSANTMGVDDLKVYTFQV